MDPHDVNALALLGGLPGTDGAALHQATGALVPGQAAFAPLAQLALAGGGQRTAGSALTVEEAFARLAALGYQPSPTPVAYHCVEDGCHARAQLMIDRLLQLGVGRAEIRRAWAFSGRATNRAAPRMRPTDESGAPLRDYAGGGDRVRLPRRAGGPGRGSRRPDGVAGARPGAVRLAGVPGCVAPARGHAAATPHVRPNN
jgi:hypothetical protein